MKASLHGAIVLLAVFAFAGCEDTIFGSSEDDNAEITAFSIVQSGETIRWGPYARDVQVKPGVPFDVFWKAEGDPGSIKLSIVHEWCGEVHHCGPDFPKCPSATVKTSGGTSQFGVTVSGLPAGAIYQMSIQYTVDGGGWGYCEWLDLTSDTVKLTSAPSVKLTPLTL